MKVGNYEFLDYGEVEVYRVRKVSNEIFEVSLSWEDARGITWLTTLTDNFYNLKEEFKLI